MSLKQRAILVSLTVSKPKVSEKDKGATRETALLNNASEAAVAVVKKLYPKHLFDPIVAAESAARRYVESVTAPWARGMALLPSSLVFPFRQQMQSHKVKFDQAVTAFLNNMAAVLQEAAKQQGGLFDPSVYPDMATLKAQFSFSVSFHPIGTESDVVLELEKESLDELREEVAQNVRNTLVESSKAVYQRMFDAVQRIHTQCAKEDGKIYDTLTGNLDELLVVLPELDMSGNEAFRQLCVTARQSLAIPAEAIRNVPGVRERTAAEAARILEQMKGFL